MARDKTIQAPRNYPAMGVMIWWSVFGLVSVYWSLGGDWLLDTAIQAEGLALAEELPLWLTMLVLLTAVVKFSLALFGYLISQPDRLRLPHWVYGAFGLVSGVASTGYGLMFSFPGLPYVLEGDMTTFRWMRMLVWMPQFWVGGILILLATFVYWRRVARPEG